MLNNEFRLIGRIISDFEKEGDSFPKYKMKIEVERKTRGKVSIYPLVVLEKNHAIDVSVSLKGKRAIVSGYIDEYKGYLSLTVQDIIIIGDGVETTENQVIAPVTVSDSEEEDKQAQKILNELELPDDDLPF